MPTLNASKIAEIARADFTRVYRNPSPGLLYQHSVLVGSGTITNLGALATTSGEKTGRCPADKRVVDQAASRDDVWWGPVNFPLSDESFAKLRNTAIDFLDTQDTLYVVDGFAGWELSERIKVRVICSRPYHALFMHNMLVRPTMGEAAGFGEPDYVIYNAGVQAADPNIDGVTSTTSVSLNFGSGEVVILGTEYAGEMKKGVFTIMNYLMPKRGLLSMHASCNVGPDRDTTLFFGLSGTGKTTLSADNRRQLIGDDEHCWSDSGVFNVEGGCYAKCIGLTQEKEPEIYNAIQFGSLLENTVQHPVTHRVDFDDTSLTQNTRCAYPIDYVDNAKIPCIAPHPSNIVLLTCDAFGVLPPVSRLTPAETMYHFINGYTAKVAGTVEGITEPTATFSACFGDAFLVWHPTKYAEMLAEKMRRHQTQAYLVNTGWTGGGYGVGKRISLKHTRAIIDAIHSGVLSHMDQTPHPIFGIGVPLFVPRVPREILDPRATWDDAKQYDVAARGLAQRFIDNFAKYADEATEEIRAAGPIVGSP